MVDGNHGWLINVNNPLIGPYFLGGGGKVALGGVPSNSHENMFLLEV